MPRRRRHGPSPAKAAAAAMVVGALGVVFGDIGTSPLYTLRETFTHGSGMTPTPRHVLGVLSILFWAVTLTVTIKYVTLIMRADNKGEGGVLALATLATQGLNGRRPQDPARHHAVRGDRSGAVLWRRHHHAGDDRDERRRGPRSPWRPAFTPYVVPMSLVILVGAVRPAVARHRRCRPAVRAGHAGLVPRAGRAGRLADRQAPAAS